MGEKFKQENEMLRQQLAEAQKQLAASQSETNKACRLLAAFINLSATPDTVEQMINWAKHQKSAPEAVQAQIYAAIGKEQP